ncbi:Arm DNA-binding domain-containing protein, partial [Rhodovulum sulfidophilum]|nr:Arm DNA-binding domain-containing protein [Rhodovulum sulfidophilum]
MAEINKLNARRVATIAEPGRWSDGANLYLNVTKTGAKSWIFLFRQGGRQREMGLGPAGPGGVTLAEAREAAAAARRILAQGLDPIAAKKASVAAQKAAAAPVMTFGAYADAFVRLHRGQWKNPKHAAQWAATLGDAYCADLRKRPVAAVTAEDVLAVVKPLWNEKRETASRIRQRI